MSCFDHKRYALDDGIHTPAYFHKDRVTSCKKIKNNNDKKERIEKDCDKKRLKKIAKRLKKIVIKKIAK